MSGWASIRRCSSFCTDEGKFRTHSNNTDFRCWEFDLGVQWVALKPCSLNLWHGKYWLIYFCYCCCIPLWDFLQHQWQIFWKEFLMTKKISLIPSLGTCTTRCPIGLKREDDRIRKTGTWKWKESAKRIPRYMAFLMVVAHQVSNIVDLNYFLALHRSWWDESSSILQRKSSAPCCFGCKFCRRTRKSSSASFLQVRKFFTSFSRLRHSPEPFALYLQNGRWIFCNGQSSSPHWWHNCHCGSNTWRQNVRRKRWWQQSKICVISSWSYFFGSLLLWFNSWWFEGYHCSERRKSESHVRWSQAKQVLETITSWNEINEGILILMLTISHPLWHDAAGKMKRRGSWN